MKKDTPWQLALGALGVVYGDIGTSPLYAMKSCFAGNMAVEPSNVIGLCSVCIWMILWVVTLKYIHVVLRVDNEGEGGILILSSLCSRLKVVRHGALPVVLGMLGVGLFVGDGVITPAISVVSALEGLELIWPHIGSYVVVLSLVILTGLFSLQHKGSGKLGSYFGPIMLIWFLTLAGLGLRQIILQPAILKALNPYYAVYFLCSNGFVGWKVLGIAILVVTGAEALYADMGHFGRKAIHHAWYYCVFGSLILNYLGQGSLLLQDPQAISNPFYHLVSGMALYPLIFLAMLATIIASQSVISGVFSLTWQAIMLNYMPRMRVIHPSMEKGQVYVPFVNWMLYVLTIGAVLQFQSSDGMSVAYGLSVAGVMMITTLFILLIAYNEWRWATWKLALVFVPLILMDLAFLSANVLKLFEGAWYTMAIATVVIYILFAWRRGSADLRSRLYNASQDLRTMVQHCQAGSKQRLPGTAVFMCRSQYVVPDAFTVHLKHNTFIHEKLIFLSIITQDVPVVFGPKKLDCEMICENVYFIRAYFGFKEVPNLRHILECTQEESGIQDMQHLSFFLSKIQPVSPSLSLQQRVFVFMYRNALNAYDFYKIPESQMVELGVCLVL